MTKGERIHSDAAAVEAPRWGVSRQAEGGAHPERDEQGKGAAQGASEEQGKGIAQEKGAAQGKGGDAPPGRLYGMGAGMEAEQRGHS